jgi:hypothetical protein
MTQVGKRSGDQPDALASDLLWNIEAIAEEINRTPRQTLHMLRGGRIPAKKIGAFWCASRTGLRRHFDALLAGEGSSGEAA